MKKKKSILILTADAGFGHRSAANAVAEVLMEKYGSECQCMILNPIYDRPVPFFFRQSMKDYDQTVRKNQAFYHFTYEVSDLPVTHTILEGALSGLLYKVMRDLIIELQPNAIVSTYQLYNAPIGTVLSVTHYPAPFFTVVTDLAFVHRMWFQPSPNTIFVGSDKIRSEALSRGIAEEKISLTGIPIHPGFTREKRCQPEIRKDLGWNPDLTTILAVSSRRVEHMVDHLEAINTSGYPLQLAVVAGGDDVLYHQIQEIEWHIPAYLYNYVENIPEMMHASNILVSKAGGLIIAESLACSLPIIMIDFIAGQETGNISFILEKDAGALAETPQELLSILASWLKENQRELRAVSSRAGSIGKPDAASRIAETIWEAMN